MGSMRHHFNELLSESEEIENILPFLSNSKFEYDDDELSPCALSQARPSRVNSATMKKNLMSELSDDEKESHFSLLPSMRFTPSSQDIPVTNADADADEEQHEQRPSISAECDANTSRSVYLVTYAQADTLKAGDRRAFAEKIVNEFNRSDDIVGQWCCSVELHKVEGLHYHMGIKLLGNRRWVLVRNNMKKLHGIDLHFGNWHTSYYDVYTYVTKHDTNFITSAGHEGFDNPPRTDNAIRRRRSRTRASATGPSDSAGAAPTKPLKSNYVAPKLTVQQVGDIIVKNNLKTVKHLHGFANSLAKNGKHDLKMFIQSHPNPKYIQDILSTNWSIETAVLDLDREKKTRMQLLEECLTEPCNVEVESGKVCNGTWLPAAIETLQRNKFPRDKFVSLVKKALVNGRGKGSNLMITGPTSCAKSFLLMPLTLVYRAFMSPSSGSYNWVGAPEKEMIFLNDIRYEEDGDRKVMEWRIFLNLLEGAPVNISMPKNFFAQDYVWEKKQPIFATAENEIIRIKNGKVDVGESAQMAQRWNIIQFTHQYLDDEINDNLIPCKRCFAELILL